MIEPQHDSVSPAGSLLLNWCIHMDNKIWWSALLSREEVYYQNPVKIKVPDWVFQWTYLGMNDYDKNLEAGIVIIFLSKNIFLYN